MVPRLHTHVQAECDALAECEAELAEATARNLLVRELIAQGDMP